MDDRDPRSVEAIRRRLDAHRAEITARIGSLRRQFDEIVEASALTTNDDEHDPEGATIAFERAQVSGLLRRARAELGELDMAGKRLDTGDYGDCERCGEPIAEERLEARPAATLCVGCANRLGR